VRLRHDPGAFPSERRNLLWVMFTDADNRARMVDWEPAARAVLSQFRAVVGQRPDPRFAELVAALTEASPEFRAWWADYPIRTFRPATIGIDQPGIGRFAFEMFQFRFVEHPDLLMVLHVPAPEERERFTALLAESRAGLASPPP
jgi:transcription regulator MmyB-like protein